MQILFQLITVREDLIEMLSIGTVAFSLTVLLFLLQVSVTVESRSGKQKGKVTWLLVHLCDDGTTMWRNFTAKLRWLLVDETKYFVLGTVGSVSYNN